MSLTTTTHLNFRGDARQALEFYATVFGGQVTIFTNADAHSVEQPSEAEQVKWGQVESDGGFRLMAFDVPASQPWDRGENGVFVSVRSSDADEITARWAALSDGATVVQDLGPAGWSPLYGMLRDRFGVTWVLDVAVAYDAA